MKKQPTLLTIMQKAAGCVNYAMNCIREGDRRSARTYAERANESLILFMNELDDPTITAGFESQSTSQ